MLIDEFLFPAVSVTVKSELATIEEATAILLEKMSASKVARLLATLQVGTGDYLKARDQLFGASGTADKSVRFTPSPPRPFTSSFR